MKTVRIVLSDTAYIQFDVEDEFNYKWWLQTIKADGHYFDGVAVFVPYASIRQVIMLDKDVMTAAVESQGMVRQ